MKRPGTNRRKKTVAALWMAIGLALFFVGTPAHADKRELFAEAQAEFDRGLALSGQEKRIRMSRAAQLFLDLYEEHHVENGFLFFNIGNAFYEAGELGRAILYYRRAQRLIPGSPELEYNMNLARQDLNVPAADGDWWDGPIKGLFFWHFMFDFDTRKSGFIALFVLFWAVKTVGIFRRHILVGALSTLLLIASCGLGGSFAVSSYERHLSKTGVLVETETEARKGPSKSYERFYEQALPGGMEFELIDDRGQWWKVELPNGDRCWVESRSGRLI